MKTVLKLRRKLVLGSRSRPFGAGAGAAPLELEPEPPLWSWSRSSRFVGVAPVLAPWLKNKLVKFLNNMNFFRSNVQFSASLNGWPFYF